MSSFTNRVATAAIAAVAWPCCAAAAAESPAPIAFADDAPISLSSTRVDVQVVNNTAVEWTLSVSAYVLGADGGGERIAVAADLPTTIGAGDSATLALGPVPGDVQKASGFVVVTGRRDGETTIARGKLLVAQAVPKPQVTKWSGSNQHFTISGAASGVPDLPLEGSV
jgi:hypothetical protein